MFHSLNGTQLVASFEGVKLEAYQDAGGVWTIGYGHTGPEVKEGFTITHDLALEYLNVDLAAADKAVNHLVKVALTQNQFDALVSLVYNIGQGNLASSWCLHLINNRQFAEAADKMLLWNQVKGVVVDGLTARRQKERALFLS